MNPLCRFLLCLATVTLVGSAVAMAQTAPATSGTPAVQSQPQAPAPAPAKPQTPPAAGVANGSAADASQPATAEPAPSTASLIAAGLPRYEPPKPAPEKPADQTTDLRDVDKPQNEIIRLPSYYVRSAREAVLKDPDLVSQKGMADIGFRDYPGLKLFPFSWLNWLNSLNANTAKEMYLQDQRLDKIADLNDTADAIGRGGDTNESEYIKRLTQETYLQPIEWGGLFPEK
jgi:hypothetical protein